MTHRVTLDVPTVGLQYGIPYITSADANSTVEITETGANSINWSGVSITHSPEPGTVGTASVSVHKQSDDSLVAETNTTGTIYLYYPNNAEYANANLASNQGTCEWDTYYYLEVTPNSPADRREQIAIRKLTTTTQLNN